MKADTHFSELRVHCPEKRSKAKVVGNYEIHFFGDEGTIETVYRSIISVNQLSIYGAVSDMCEECDTCHVRTERLALAGQSDPLFVPTKLLMKTPTPSTDDPAQDDLLHKYQKMSGKDLTTKSCDYFCEPIKG